MNQRVGQISNGSSVKSIIIASLLLIVNLLYGCNTIYKYYKSRSKS